MRIRQSYLGTADDCLRKLQYQIESPIRLSGAVRAVGTGYHAGLAYLYSERMKGMVKATPEELILVGQEAFDVELKGAGESFIWDKANFPTRRAAHEGIDFLLTTFEEGGYEWPADWQVLGVELDLRMEWQGHERTAQPDLVMLDPNGWVVIEDHKTAGKRWNQGKEHPRKNNQAPWYVPMVESIFPGANGYRFVFGIMTYKGVFERRITGEPRAILGPCPRVVTRIDGSVRARATPRGRTRGAPPGTRARP